MIRHAPAENYFKYLVAHPSTYDDGYIQEVAQELGLDYLGDWYMQWLRGRVRPPSPFYPEDRGHAASQRFLLREGLHSIFLPTRDMDEAHRIVSRPRWRELVETMVLSGAPNESISHAIRSRCKGRVSAEGVRLYKYFFWNIDLLDSMQMRALLEMRHSGALAIGTDEDRRKQTPAMYRFRHTDPRVVAARLPSSPLAALAAQMELGALPRRVDLGEVIEQTRQAAVLQTYLAVQGGGPMGSQMGQGYAVIADIMNRLQAAVVNPEDKLREELRRISVATTSNKIPTVQQLTGGNHTVNVHPEPKSEDVVETTSEDVEDEEDAP